MKIDRMKLLRAWSFARRHAFALFCILALGYMFFFGEYSVKNIFSLRKEEAELRHEKRVYQDSLDQYNKRLEELNTDNAQLEKLARERMLMHKANEDVYVTK